MKIIATLWDSYRKEVLPVDASPTQVSECRMAFYSGATALFSSLLHLLDETDDVTDTDIQVMESISRELNSFADSLQE
jgi:hypothetical protein